MRILMIFSLLYLTGYPLIAQSYCTRAKLFLNTYEKAITYQTTRNLEHNPALWSVQQGLNNQLRNLRDSMENPSLYELNCQRLLNIVIQKILKLQAYKAPPPAAASLNASCQK